MEIQELAKQVLSYFEVRETKGVKKVGSLKRSTPEWVIELVHDAVVEINSDEFILKHVYLILESLSQGKEAYQIELNPDIYLEDLFKWVLGHPCRQNVCDGIVKVGIRDTLQGVIKLAQEKELKVIFDGVIETLKEELERINRKESTGA